MVFVWAGWVPGVATCIVRWVVLVGCGLLVGIFDGMRVGWLGTWRLVGLTVGLCVGAVGL